MLSATLGTRHFQRVTSSCSLSQFSAMAPKRKTDEEKPTTSKKLKAEKPAAPALEPEEGWVVHKPSLIYKMKENAGFSKIAAFDFDGTLVKTKSGLDFARGADDYKLFHKGVPDALKKLHKAGYKLVIFSNQNAIKKALEGKAAENTKARMDAAVRDTGVPFAAAFMATLDDEYRKPDRGMWTFLCEHLTDGIKPDLSQCFFVGDAAGRPGDHAATDKEFADTIGIRFQTPEECFGAPPKGPNDELVACFERLAQKYRKDGDNFKSNAFRKVALRLQSESTPVTSGKEASKLKDIGKGSAGLIDEWLTTGRMAVLEEDEAGAQGAAAGGEDKKQGDEGKKPSQGLAFL